MRESTIIIVCAMICVTVLGVFKDGAIITAVAGLITSVGGVVVYTNVRSRRKKGKDG